MTSPSKAHHRILKLEVTVDANNLQVQAVKYYRDRAKLEDDDPFHVEHTAGDAGTTTEVEFGELIPPASHVIVENVSA